MASLIYEHTRRRSYAFREIQNLSFTYKLPFPDVAQCWFHKRWNQRRTDVGQPNETIKRRSSKYKERAPDQLIYIGHAKTCIEDVF
jgi:hypothetical protein